MQQQLVTVQDLGVKPYKEVWDYQEIILQKNVALKRAFYITEPAVADSPLAIPHLPPTTHHLLLVEHPPVYTLGKSGHEENILIDEATRRSKGIEYFKINRGGDITFHGPAQLVGYPILDLEKFRTDIGWYLRSLEEVVIKTIAHFGIVGARSVGETGVWIDVGIKGRERKICAMGVRCSRWITMHGWALNVNTDLDYFKYIIPCGIVDKQVTSMEKELGRPVDMGEVKQVLLDAFAGVFEVDVEGVG
ncbi:MAG: lipoyl(octanoyl) transferase LipB [Chitinophagaceae bacterium]